MLNNRSTPRAKFILWRLLATKDRLLCFQIATNGLCVFCQAGTEDINHLLFACPVIDAGLQALMAWLGIVGIRGSWHSVMMLSVRFLTV